MSTTPEQHKKSCWNLKSRRVQPVSREIRATQEHKALPVPIMRYAQETR